jgi:hypothetical protein
VVRSLTPTFAISNTPSPFVVRKQAVRKQIVISCFCAIALFSAQLHAAKTEETEPVPRILMLEPLDSSRDAASKQVTAFANWLDSFFADDRIYEESQKSHLKLNLLHISEEGYEPRYEAKLQGKLTLPHTQERLKILFESDPEEDAAPDTTVVEAVESQDQSLGLRYIQYTSKWFRAHTDAGIRFRSGFDTFARFRLRGIYALEKWQFRAAETIFWRDSIGAGETSRLDIERRMGKDYLFRSTSQATWLDDTRQFDMGQDFYLIHTISKYRGVIYRTGLTAVSEPEAHTTAYILSVRLRQQIHRDWLFFEINPKVLYPKEEDFHSRHSLTFKLEVVFGGA